MAQESEIEFLKRRAGAELDLADASRDEKIADIHRQLAMAYARKVAELGEMRPAFRMEGNARPQPATSMR